MLTTIAFAGPGSPIQFRAGAVEQPANATYDIPVGAYSITTDVAKKIITDNHFRFDYMHANLLGTATADPKERCYGKVRVKV